MKIRSLLLVGLLAGQVMPVVGMHHNFFELVKNQMNAVRGSMQHLAWVMKSNPTLLVLVGGACGLAHLYSKYEVGYKLDCYFGKISLESQLLRATRKGDLITMEKLLNQGADPNVYARSPRDGLLVNAILGNNEKMLDLAIKAGADVNAQNFLYLALWHLGRPFNKQIAKKLIEAGAFQDAPIEFAPSVTTKQFAQASAAHTGNQDYINIFKPESKLL